MQKRRPTSVVILITLAELAWLAAFGLLFAYRGKVGELGALHRKFDAIELGARDVPGLVDERDRAITQMTNLQARLNAVTKQVSGRTPEEVEKLLVEAERSAALREKEEEERRKVEGELHSAKEKLGAIQAELVRTQRQLQATNEALAELGQKWDALEKKAAELERAFLEATNRSATAGSMLVTAEGQIAELSNRVTVLQSGEVSIRRELIGLPTNDLRRVIFLVDTSSSMRDSPAWTEARRLMRIWVEYLSVEECLLVNFNDQAVPFPSKGYQRIRGTDGETVPGKRQELLEAFDRARPGTYTDLLKGLNVAYSSNGVPDIIVLFTDGHPHVSTRSDASFAAEILREVGRHPKVPILAVGVGSYEVEGSGGPRERANPAIAFLKRLAAVSGGSFIGR